MRRNFGGLILVGGAALCGGCSERGNERQSLPQQQLMSVDTFGSETIAKGWRLTDWNLEDKAAELAADASLAEGSFWQSPPIDIAPLEYFKIEVSTRGSGRPWVGGMGYNANAEWGRYPHEAAIAGELVADNWTAWEPVGNPDQMVSRTFFSRAGINATSSGVRLMGSGVEFRNLRVTRASAEDVGAWADSIYDEEMVPLDWEPASSLAAVCPRAKALLSNGGRLRMALLGDSIMSDTGNSTIDVLLERSFPKCRVEVITAVGGGTGAGAWLNDQSTSWPKHDLDLNAAVIQTEPDLVVIGGISNGQNWREDIPALIQKIRSAAANASKQQPEILLLTGAFGRESDPPDYADGLAAIAVKANCGFFDIRAVTEAYIDSAVGKGYPRAHFFRDPVHANHRGKELLARVLLKFFQAQ